MWWPAKVMWYSWPAPTVNAPISDPSWTMMWAELVPGLSRWMLSPTMPNVAVSNHWSQLVVAAWSAVSAQTSLKDWKYWTRCEALMGWSEVMTTGPPMGCPGNVTCSSVPAATVTAITLEPSATLTWAVEAPGLNRWMLSPTMPAVALSNQLK